MNQCLICDTETHSKYCSLQCSKIGIANSTKERNKTKYQLNPKFCIGCGLAIPYEKRWTNKFCNSSCSATTSNKSRILKDTKKKIKLSQTDKSSKKMKQWLEAFSKGKVFYRRIIRKCIIHLHGNKCQNCGIEGMWDDKPLTLIVDHINGDAGNNMPDNLRLLCPNCNSQTSTFCGRNFGNGRGSKGLSLS
jgi:hypothetical protein